MAFNRRPHGLRKELLTPQQEHSKDRKTVGTRPVGAGQVSGAAAETGLWRAWAALGALEVNGEACSRPPETPSGRWAKDTCGDSPCVPDRPPGRDTARPGLTQELRTVRLSRRVPEGDTSGAPEGHD